MVILLTCADDYIKYSHGLIADYLPADLSKQLADSLGFVSVSLSVYVSLWLSGSIQFSSFQLYKNKPVRTPGHP